jgi:hypothetical protein
MKSARQRFFGTTNGIFAERDIVSLLSVGIHGGSRPIVTIGTTCRVKHLTAAARGHRAM